MGDRNEAMVWAVARAEAARTLDVDLLVVPQSLSQVRAPVSDCPVLRRSGDIFAAAAVVLVEPAGEGVDRREHARSVGARLGRRYGDVRSMATTMHLLGDGIAEAFLSGLSQGRYRYRDQVSCALTFAETPDPQELSRVLDGVLITEEAVTWVRRLVDTPAGRLTPLGMAAAAGDLAALPGVDIEIWDEERCAAERFTGVVTVGAGSSNPPRVIVAGYRGDSSADRPDLVLVGKGITFDSGGLSMKSAGGMLGMKSDMAGGATALGVIRALARSRVAGVHVVAVVPCAENLPGPGAVLPGDVITHRNGVTSEVVNTDCEGRLAMADALVFAAEMTPARIVDIATLTYATLAALGVDITSVLGNDDTLRDGLIAAGRAVGEPIWALPLWQPYRRLIDSTMADLRNEESLEQAAAITAALFLQNFVGGVAWAHLDIGGTGYLDEDISDGPSAGATGVLVRTLLTFITGLVEKP
jgi:leucyl aminopeptidase